MTVSVCLCDFDNTLSGVRGGDRCLRSDANILKTVCSCSMSVSLSLGRLSFAANSPYVVFERGAEHERDTVRPQLRTQCAHLLLESCCCFFCFLLLYCIRQLIKES